MQLPMKKQEVKIGTITGTTTSNGNFNTTLSLANIIILNAVGTNFADSERFIVLPMCATNDKLWYFHVQDMDGNPLQRANINFQYTYI